MTNAGKMATRLYEQRQKDCERLVELLKTELQAHRERRGKDSVNYGFIGDLVHVREGLKDVVVFLSQRTEAEVEDAINRS